MKTLVNAYIAKKLVYADGGPGEWVAAGSMIAGIGLLMVSILVVLAIGFLAGALVLVERLARNVLGASESHAEERRVMPEIEMA